MALRRTLEHIGVLTHIWARPETVDALRDTDSKEYIEAFRREVDSQKAKVLRDSKTTKRFAAMRMGSVATIIYETLSATDVHGGTSARFVLYASQPTDLMCSFTMRPDPNSEQTIKHIRFLVDGHRTICFEVMNLCVQHAEPSEELSSAAQSLKMLASVAGERSPELDEQVARLLNQLGVARQEGSTKAA